MNFGMKYMLMNEAILGDTGGGSAGGGAAAGGDMGNGGNAASNQATVQETYTPPEWAKGLTIDPEILKAPMFASIKGVDDVVKGYYHAQKLVGADKIVVPTKASSPEQWKEYYVKAGLPADIIDYKAEFPASIEDKEFQANLTKKAYELNVRPDQLQAIVTEMEAYNDKLVQSYEAETKQAIISTAAELKKEWGNDYQRNLLQSQRVIQHFGGEEMLEKVMKSPLASDGDFLRLMQKISGSLTKEDTFQQDVVARFGTSAEEAQRQINEIYGNHKGPYYDETHAQHGDMVAKMLSLQQIISESQNKA